MLLLLEFVFIRVCVDDCGKEQFSRAHALDIGEISGMWRLYFPIQYLKDTANAY